MTPLETFARICAEAVRECGSDADIATIEAAIRSRLVVLPANVQTKIEEAVKTLASYQPPGFHEHGAH